VKTRFEIEEEKAAQSDARCLFFERSELFEEIAIGKTSFIREKTLDFLLQIWGVCEYTNHGNCNAYDVYRQTLLELIDQHDKN
jgi:hypothetical protein